MVWNLKERRRSLPTTENRIKVIAEGDFLVKGNFDMSKRKRRGNLKWRSKRANHGKKPNLG